MVIRSMTNSRVQRVPPDPTSLRLVSVLDRYVCDRRPPLSLLHSQLTYMRTRINVEGFFGALEKIQ